MQKLLPLFLFLSSFLSLFAQNDYQLFRPGVQYVYDNPEVDWYDWFGYNFPYQGMRTTEANCDSTYLSLRWKIMEYDNFTLRPAFAGYRVCQYENYTDLQLNEDGSKVLRLELNEGVGHEWIAMDGVYGRVLSVSVESFLGLTDTVKNIQFYDAAGLPLYDEIPLKISKSYGLVKGVYFYEIENPLELYINLVGMDTHEAGIQNINNETVFALEPGDEIHIENYSNESTPDETEWYYVYLHQKLVIDSLIYDGAGVLQLYRCTGEEKQFYQGLFAPTTDVVYSWLSDFDIDAKAQDWLDTQPGSLNYFDDGRLRLTTLKEWDCGLSRKHVSGALHLASDGISLSTVIDGIPGLSYIEGLGGVYGNYQTVGTIYGNEIQYFNRSGESCGTPFDFIVNSRDLYTDYSFSVFPNPGTGSLRLDLPDDLQYPIQLELLDITGAILTRRALSGPDERIDFGVALADGVYLITLRDRTGRLGCTKWVKQ